MATPLLILRIRPAEPMAPADFRTALTGLSIIAYDLSFANDVVGTKLGTAKNLAPPHLTSTTNNNVNVNQKGLIQHYIDVEPAPLQPLQRFLESVATAVIVVTPPGTPEYPSPESWDLRLEITRDTNTIADHRLDFNVSVIDIQGALPTDQKVYMEYQASAYVTLPPGLGLDPDLASVDVPSNGQAPNFNAICEAIDRVLAKDPGPPDDDLLHRSPLTAAEATQVASEIIWNRAEYPPPEPPTGLGLDPFGAMYTKPKVDPNVSEEDIATARMKFESEQQGYYGTHEAQALQLAGFVFSASAAIAAEQLSAKAMTAQLDFPVETGGGTSTTYDEASVALADPAGLAPPFIVPAAYFYALAATVPAQVTAEQRYKMACLELESRLLGEFSTAAEGNVISVPAAPFTAPAGVKVNSDQAARRLRALGSPTASLTQVALTPPLAALATDWLEYTGTTASIDTAFWAANLATAAYLVLLLTAITETFQPLIDAIKEPPFNVTKAADLPPITDQQWRDLFLGPSPPPGAPPRLALLPPFTQPGTPAERVEAFIRHLHNFFAVAGAASVTQASVPGSRPMLGLSMADAFAAFAAAYAAISGGPLVFGTPLNSADVTAAAASVFVGDPTAQAWLIAAIEAIEALYELTEVGLPELQFSLMEALYARGFTTAQAVASLSGAEFASALTGTVAYPYASEIYAKSGGGGGAPTSSGPFTPVNPDGSLTDCIPPAHLSPLGPLQYLHEMLEVSAASSCKAPLQPADAARLEVLVAGRRGPVGELLASGANLDDPLPVIDMVNESLEALTAGLAGGASGGAVYDTDTSVFPFSEDPPKLLAVLPQHSSPATPVAQPGAYELLRNDFTAPALPYAQTLDVCRSYLGELGSNRYSTMRHFRKDITELAIDADAEPADFVRHQWRYPVRLEIALEYLRISREEYELLYVHDIVDMTTPGRLMLRELYGFSADIVENVPWTEIVVRVPEFLRRTGLSYCELLELQLCGFVVFRAADREQGFPECEPCCLDDFVIEFVEPSDPLVALRELAVFIRLWRRLQQLSGPQVTFTQLRDIAEVLELFQAGAINPEFIRQLAALLIFRDSFCLPLSDRRDPQPGASGADRTALLAFWVGPGAGKWTWAVQTLLERLEEMAKRCERGRRGTEWSKLLAENLDPLSVLAGFDPGTPTDTWHAQPTSTLRFAEVLWKITLSDFTVGEIVFLFTNEPHLDGDDPFPLQPVNDALDDPLEDPDDSRARGLWALRRRLLGVDAGTDEEVESWSWARIVAALRDEFGLPDGPTGVEFLTALGEHFFPSILEREGHPVPTIARRYRVGLAAAATTPAMWNTPPDGPFHYDLAAQELWVQLPLSDRAVNAKLSEIRPLSTVEQSAVSELYFSPRAALAPFSFMFENFGRAVDRLIHAGDDSERFVEMQREFARFHRRCHAIAEHLAEHVQAATGRGRPAGASVSWRLLRQLWGDENRGLTSWENDDGAPPEVTVKPQPTGGAFAALLGLAGTGLTGEFAAGGTDPAWRELRGPLGAFGHSRNLFNAPVSTVIPSMDLSLTAEQERFATVRNGFAMRNSDGERLFGAQPFTIRWQGALLVERSGEYRFEAGGPTNRGRSPDFEAAEGQHWLVTLRRGQRTWSVLNHRWRAENAPGHRSDPLRLRRGVYEIEVSLEQPEPTFFREEDVCPRHTGFEVKYRGPDSDEELVQVPFDRLFRLSADATLDAGTKLGDAATRFLRYQSASSLRDIRRTYQRAFKAILLAHLFELSAKPLRNDPESELDFMLEHPDKFAGRTYYRTGPSSFVTHQAWFDPNLLPVCDPDDPPDATEDQRVAPSAKRQAALFDIWERLFDYDALRRETSDTRERATWRLFYETAEGQPDDPAQLLRRLGVDILHAPLLEAYFDLPNPYTIAVADLEAEPWAVRIWQGEKWLRALERRFLVKSIGEAVPASWAADDPDLGAPSGNENLTRFVQNGCFENGEPRRYKSIAELDDGLRERARHALVSYLCGMDRVGLPFAPGLFAHEARDLSDLFLQDVGVGIHERASRIEDAVSAVQAFVQRARLGLEPSFTVTPEFVAMWDGRFADFHVWECCKQREVYRENWIDWDELRAAREAEAFQFLERELREATLTVAVPGGLDWWPATALPAHPCLELLQVRQPSRLRLLEAPPLPENLELMGTPESQATPSWLAPCGTARQAKQRPSEAPQEQPQASAHPDAAPEEELAVVSPSSSETSTEAELELLPLWIQAAVRLGTRFVRVAAAGEPPASKPFAPCTDAEPCCGECGGAHRPLVDEYYFWLVDTRHFEAVTQEAEVGSTTTEQTSDWDRPAQLATLLGWPSEPMAHLFWSRVHNGEFQPPRRSGEGLAIDPSALTPGELPQLEYEGRSGDSLRFQVSGAISPVGYTDPTPAGFRYDIATDEAVCLPLLAPLPALRAGTFPGGLEAYPFFAYFCPGAPVIPMSPFSIAISVAAALRARCRFEAALKWYELAYDPLQSDDAWALCTRPQPDRSPTRQGASAVVDEQPAAAVQSTDVPSDRLQGDLPCCIDVIPEDDIARQRAILLHYLETLLQWGDGLLCRRSPEAARQADVIFAVIERVLGERPATIFAADTPGSPPTVAAFLPRPAGLNPRLMALYDRTADRVQLIHHSENGHRRRDGLANIEMPYFGEDPQRGAWICSDCGCCDCECGSCCDAYRFTFRVQKALELAAEVRAFGGELLGAYEKRDAEYLASLHAAHERQMLELGLEVRKDQWRDADWQVQALQKTKESAQTRLRYYQGLIANGLNGGEIGYEALTAVSIASRAAGNISEAIAQAMGMVPDMWVGVAGIAGTPVELDQLPVGNKLGSDFSTAARILNALAEIASSSGALSLTEGGWDRREAEWRLQVEVIGIEIEQIERQLLGAERRRDVALRELNNQQRQIEHSIEVQDFLRDKFTNHELYLFLAQETSALYRQSYDLALATARRVERAFNYERGFTSRRFLPEADWDDLHEGLMAGERLQVALRRMEKAYLDENCREYELSKHVSLRLSLPLAFLQLQATGHCEVELPEWMFDLDYPGHYMRRIKSVTLSIPCVAGPYTGVHCRLTLLSSQTRVDPRLGSAPHGCCEEPCDCRTDDSCCCCEPRSNPYEALPSDPRVVRSYAASEAIATSSGQNDSGLFELSFHDERYLPFEFAGAVSRWRIELPRETNYFDFETLTDVVLHVNYTAREGGDALRRGAGESARCRLPGDGLRLIDARRDLPDAWYTLTAPYEDAHAFRRLPLRLSTAMFPFVPTRRTRWVDGLKLLFAAPGAEPSTNHLVRFHPGEHRHEQEHDCGCDAIDVECVASDEYPGLYWGVVDLRDRRLGPLEVERAVELGSLEFPARIGEICEVKLIAVYCADPWPRCGVPEHGCRCGCSSARAGGEIHAPGD